MKPSEAIITVVEDDVAVCEAIARLLRATRFGPETYSSTVAFLNRPAGQRVGCLIFDIHLDGMSGFELRRLAAVDSHLPVISLTADESAATREHAERAMQPDTSDSQFRVARRTP